MRFALLTCDPLPEPDHDEAPLTGALRAGGHEAQPIPWDDPETDFSAFDALILRATWDYSARYLAFLEWIERPEVACRLWNPPAVVRWNMHKGYLLELRDAGVPIVPTALCPTADAGPETIARIAHEHAWRDIVVKPAISAGSRRTRRFTGDAIDTEADAFVASWSDGVEAMVQPYLASVEGGAAGHPERAIVWIDGLVTHVVEKSRRFAGDHERVACHGEPTPEDVAFAVRVIDAYGFDPLYARIDVMDAGDGRTVLSELELIEPSLFFPLRPGSAEIFADACVRRAHGAQAASLRDRPV